MTIDKQFHGDLEGTSKGQMLAAGDPKTSGVYVAIEKFNGTLKGRSGGFILHHTGLMNSRRAELNHGGAGIRHRTTGGRCWKYDHQHCRRWQTLL